MAKLYVLIGPPGAGKSTWRARYQHLHPGATVISQDDLVDAYASERVMTYSEAFRVAPIHEFAATVMSNFRDAVSRGDDIILDRTNMRKKARGAFLRMAKGYETVAVEFLVDPIVLEDRLRRRAAATGKIIPENVVSNMIRTYEPPDYGEFDTIVTHRYGPPTLMQKARHHVRRLLSY